MILYEALVFDNYYYLFIYNCKAIIFILLIKSSQCLINLIGLVAYSCMHRIFYVIVYKLHSITFFLWPIDKASSKKVMRKEAKREENLKILMIDRCYFEI